MQTNPRSVCWRKAQRSMTNGNCVEVGLADGVVAVRDSKHPGGCVLKYTAESWRVFTHEARQDNFGMFG
ncbi:MAG: DUF397 domain-containing protein [Trebonia sp.]